MSCIIQGISPVIVISTEGRNLEDSRSARNDSKGEISSPFVTEGHGCFILCKEKFLRFRSRLYPCILFCLLSFHSPVIPAEGMVATVVAEELLTEAIWFGFQEEITINTRHETPIGKARVLSR
ncbi:MAG: hypothetical protein ACK41Q_02940 [Candidatus Brocadia sp.]